MLAQIRYKLAAQNICQPNEVSDNANIQGRLVIKCYSTVIQFMFSIFFFLARSRTKTLSVMLL